MKVSVNALIKLKQNAFVFVTSQNDDKNEQNLNLFNNNLIDSSENKKDINLIDIDNVVCDTLYCEEGIDPINLKKITSSIVFIEKKLIKNLFKETNEIFLKSANSRFFDVQKEFINIDKSLIDLRLEIEKKNKELNLIRQFKNNDILDIKSFNLNLLSNKIMDFPENFDVYLPFRIEKMKALDIFLGTKNNSTVNITLLSLDYGEVICEWTLSIKIKYRWIHLLLPETLGPDVYRGVLKIRTKPDTLCGYFTKIPKKLEYKLPLRPYFGIKNNSKNKTIKSSNIVSQLKNFNLEPKNSGEIIHSENKFLNVTSKNNRSRIKLILNNKIFSNEINFSFISKTPISISIEYFFQNKWKIFAQNIKVLENQITNVEKVFSKQEPFDEIIIKNEDNKKFLDFQIREIGYDWNSLTTSIEPFFFNENYGLSSKNPKILPQLINLENLKNLSQLPLVTALCPINKFEDIRNLCFQMKKQVYPKFEILIGINGGLSLSKIEKFVSDQDLKNLSIFDLNDSSNLGSVLNELIKNSNGDYYFKIDADDYYGKKYFLEAISASKNLNYKLISKRSSFMYIKSTNETYIRSPKYEMSEQQIGFGGTICVHKSIFEESEITFRNDTKQGTDLAFFLDCEIKGIKNFSTSYYNYTYVRKNFDKNSHTWQTTREHLIKDSILIGDEKSIELFEN